MNEEEEKKYRKLVEEMVECAFQLDKEGYTIRSSNPDSYKYCELFEAAIKLREASDKLEYALS